MLNRTGEPDAKNCLKQKQKQKKWMNFLKKSTGNMIFLAIKKVTFGKSSCSMEDITSMNKYILTVVSIFSGCSIPDIIEEIAKEDEEKHKRHFRRFVARQERLKVRPPRLGKHKYGDLCFRHYIFYFLFLIVIMATVPRIQKRIV